MVKQLLVNLWFKYSNDIIEIKLNLKSESSNELGCIKSLYNLIQLLKQGY